MNRLIRETGPAGIGGLIRASSTGPSCDGGPRRQTLEMFIIALGMAVLLAVAGAFGTGSWDFGARLSYWLISTCVGYGVAILSYDLIHHLMRSLARPLVATGIFVATGTPLIAVFVWLIAPLLFHSDLTLSSFLSVLWPILTINIALLALKFFLAGRHPAAAKAPPAMAAHEVRLLQRLPAAFQSARIRAVSAEDHYLRVYTDLGEVLILMRLRDAVDELKGLEGLQIHRSWWVAKDAVERVTRKKRRLDLILTGNITAPVSRACQSRLKTNGWV